MNRRTLLKATALASIHQTAHPGAPTFAAQPSTPAPQASLFPGLLAQNVESLPMAEVGEVAIVASSDVFGSSAGFIIHNNFGISIDYDEAQGVARDANGTLVGVIETERAAPKTIRPWQYCLGYAEFDKELDPGVSIEIEPSFELGGSKYLDYVDLTVSEVSISGDRIIGIVENHTEANASRLSHVIGIFFDPAGAIVGVTRTYMDASSIPVGGFSTFSARVKGGVATDAYLFASSGLAD